MDVQVEKVFKKVLTDAVKNIIFYGIGAFAIAFIGNALSLRILGIILAGLFTFVVFLSLIPFLISFFAGLIAIPLAIRSANRGDKNTLRETSYLSAGTIVQFIENGICLLYVFYLYRAFFK